jgi:RNA polymerase sigma factor (sigma-70 family)
VSSEDRTWHGIPGSRLRQCRGMSEGCIEPGPDDLVAQSRFLRALARRLIRDEHGAEDLVQDTLVVALENGIPAHRRPAPWLAGILKNLVRMSIRTDARRRRREERTTPRAPADPADVAERLESQERLLQAVRDLPEPYRATLVARYFDEMSAEDIAKGQGIPASTVRTRTLRGLALLRERLDGESRGRRAWVLALLPIARLPESTGAAAAASSTITMGAMVMSAKKILAVIAVLLILATGGAVTYVASRDDEPETARVSRTAAAGATSHESAEDTAPEAPLPEPVDLAAADRDLDLFGRITDREGTPVAGATLEALCFPWRRSRTLNIDGRDEVVIVRATRSARDGTFAIRLTRGRLVDLRIRAEGFAKTIIPRCQAGERIETVLTPGAEFLVRCMTEGGKPVAGVVVRLKRWPESRRPVVDRRGVTDVRGEALFRGLTPGKVRVTAEHPDHVADGRSDPAVPAEGRGTYDLVLPTGRTITGLVKDADTGVPIVGARVGEMWLLRRAVRTDSDGRFVIRGWIDGGYRDLHVIAEGYGRQRRIVPSEGEIEFTLHRGDEVTGRIVDCEGMPVAEALVHAVASRGRGVPEQEIDTRSCRSGPNGRFRLTSLRRDMGGHQLVVLSRGYGKLIIPFPVAEDAPGAIDLGDVVLSPGRAVEGHVLDGHGDPLAGYLVEIESAGAWVRSTPQYGDQEARRTDDLGRFRFPDLSPGSYQICLTGAETVGRITRSVDLPADRDVTDLEIRIRTARTAGTADERTLRVRVVDDTGSPVAGVWVHTPKQIGPAPRTDSGGRTVIKGVPREETWASTVIPPHIEFVADKPVRIGADQDEVTIRVLRAAMLRGVVLGPDGTPLPGVYVRSIPESSTVAYCVVFTDEKGAFSIPTSPGVAVDLETSGALKRKREHLPIRGEIRHVTGPRDDLVMRTTRVTTDRKLTVRVLDLEGHLVEGAHLDLNTRGETRAASTGPDGRAGFADLPSDYVGIRVRPGKAAGLSELAIDPSPIRLVPDGREVIARFRRGVPVAGVVLGPEGAPLEGADVMIQINGVGGPRRRTVTDPDGRFRCATLPDTSFFLSARHQSDDLVLLGSLPDVRPDGKEVTLRLEPVGKR